jgi:autotransporter-associated beta strand protein
MSSSSSISSSAMQARSRHRLFVASAACAVAAIAGTARPASAAANLFLNLNGTNVWEDGANWISGALPTTGDNAFIDSGFTVSASTPSLVCFEMQVGVGPNAYGNVGNPGGSGVLNMLSGSVITQDGNLVVGQAQDPNVDSSGTINIAGGATLNIKGGNSFIGFFGENSVGLNFATTGTVNVNGGAFNWAQNDPRSTLWLGGDAFTNRVGKGVFNLNSGSATGGAIRVGDYGQGTLTVSGGTLTSNFYMAIGLGNNPNQGHGTVNVRGGVLNLAQITLNENKTEECVINQSAGTINIGSVQGLDGYNFRIGYSDHGKGTYNMTGGTLNVSGNDLYVGRGQNGEMNISGNSVVNLNTLTVTDRPNADYAVALGGIDNGTAVINQNGGTVFIAPTSLLGIFYHGANGGTETYNLAGGTLTTNGISAEGGSTVKTFNFNGGTLIANKNFTVPNPNFGTPASFFTTVSNGGGTINTAGFDVTWTTPFTGNGALTKDGEGSLNLTAVGTYAGGTTVSAGTLLVSNTAAGSGTGSGAVAVSAGATLGGSGTVGGNATISGKLAPGSIGATGGISFGSAVTFNAGSAAAIQFAAAADVDHVGVVGTATLAGAAQLETFNGYVPAYGQTHRVLDASAISGHFTTVSGHQLTPTRWLAVTYDATGVNVTAALPGDADLNTIVGFSDLVQLAQNYNLSGRVWAQGDFNGTGTVDFDDLVVLAQNYNGTATPGGLMLGPDFAADWALAQSLVPEPTTFFVLLAPLALAARRRGSLASTV